MESERITVETRVRAPVREAWDAYTTPDRIRQWNFASSDWHCPAASVDLRQGGAFSLRMEAKDEGMSFDFAGTYTAVVPHERIDTAFGDRGGEGRVPAHERGDACPGVVRARDRAFPRPAAGRPAGDPGQLRTARRRRQRDLRAAVDAPGSKAAGAIGRGGRFRHRTGDVR